MSKVIVSRVWKTWAGASCLAICVFPAGPAVAAAAATDTGGTLARIGTHVALISFIGAFLVWGHSVRRYQQVVGFAVSQFLQPGSRLTAFDKVRLFFPVQDPRWLMRHVRQEGEQHIALARSHGARSWVALVVCIATGLVIWMTKPAV
jgi:hypothetical protein